MSELISGQFSTIMVMLCCGIAIGMVDHMFTVFIVRFGGGSRLFKVVVRLCSYVIIAFIIGEFLMFCQNGKLMFYELISLVAGLSLWRKIFCDKISAR